MSLRYQGVKRMLDCAAAGGLLVALSPLLAGLSAAIWLESGSPVLFRQQRPGYRGKLFRIAKFRTMREARDANGAALPDFQRMTRVGSVMRSLSLDELPELWNILIGEMSFVGPRPLLVQYLPLYNAEQARRHDVRPGLTGWAQVNGRNSLAWEERFKLDVYYVDHCSFLLDLRILLLTCWKVVQREGINQGENLTAEPFRGSAAPLGSG